ncbi:MAG: polyprenyl synthetase family protein [Candidatus Omnitrophica bacterium]|nr:polyprenyl synthetase family protein [Candidatus Omnitrophota bacterium]MCM8798368.1 polyprenyl synthetase family protein [Candidatus Omnitrophota bacterium]
MAKNAKSTGKDYLAEIFFPVKEELSRWKKSYRGILKREENFFSFLYQYLLSFPQKEIRPGLVFLSAKAISGERVASSLLYRLENFSTAIEVFHTALLLQNSLLQNMEIKPENNPGIDMKKQSYILLFSQYLFSQSLSLLKELKLSEAWSGFLEIYRSTIEIKIKEIDFLSRFAFSEEEYLEMIKSKTAKLLSLASGTGAYIVDEKSVLCGALENFGLNFGLALQIVDDCLKVMDEDNSFIHDFEIKKEDLSLIYLFPFLPEEERREVIGFLREEKTPLPHARSLALVYRAVELALKKAKYFSDQAKESIKILPKSKFKESLIALTDFPLERLAR